jgi:hypothetical protein
MIEIDNPPVVLFAIVLVVLLAPALYSFFVDKYDKNKPQIKS